MDIINLWYCYLEVQNLFVNFCIFGDTFEKKKVYII